MKSIFVVDVIIVRWYRFYVSLEDDLMRLFANQGALSKMLEKSFGDDEMLEHGTLDWSIQNAQKKVEQQNYSIRKRLLDQKDKDLCDMQRKCDAMRTEVERVDMLKAELLKERLKVK